jgi:hypothetical protein
VEQKRSDATTTVTKYTKGDLKRELNNSNQPDEREDIPILPREPVAEVYTYSGG